MNPDQTSPSESQHQVQQGSALVQDQEHMPERVAYFVKRVAELTRKEWETFHLEYPDVDEETFCQTQRFCVQQWVSQKATLLSNLTAFERAKNYVEWEVAKRADEIQVLYEMMEDPVYYEMQSLSAKIAAQAQQRSKQLRMAIKDLSSKKSSYLVGKVDRLRAPGQARDREKESQNQVERVKYDIETIKTAGIAIEYEKQKENLREREQALWEYVSYADQLIRESRHQIDTIKNIASLETYIGNSDRYLKDLSLKALDTYYMQGRVSPLPNDGNSSTQHIRHVQDQMQVPGGLLGGMEEAIQDVLTKAKAEIEQAKRTETYTCKVKNALKRMRKRWAKIEKWAGQEKNKAEKQKKRLIQAKSDDTLIIYEEKLIEVIERANSQTKEAIEHLENAYKSLINIKAAQLIISKKEIKLAKYLEEVKDTLELATFPIEVAATSAKKAYDSHTQAVALSDQGADAISTYHQAGQTIQEEKEAYLRAKTALEYAIRYSRELASEQQKVEEQSQILAKHFTALLQGYLLFEQDVLDYAIIGVKQTIKASLNVSKQEKDAKDAACQTFFAFDSAEITKNSLFVAKEQKSLSIAALANNSLAGFAGGYRVFHKLATEVVKENLATQLETCRDHFEDALNVVKKDLDEVKQEKKRKDLERQSTPLTNYIQQAHLLIDEQTGTITLKDGETCYLQDLVGIGEVPSQEMPGQSRLLFKDDQSWSSYDVAHDKLYERCEKRTRIHLEVPDGVGGYKAMLYLPNGTQIRVADIDLGQTKYDPARPKDGVTIILKHDGLKINLLTASCVMRELTQEVLQELVDERLNESIDHIIDAIETKEISEIMYSFKSAEIHNRSIKYIYQHIMSLEHADQRIKDNMNWMENITNLSEQAIYILREYADEALKNENFDKKIKISNTIENILLCDFSGDIYKERYNYLQKIVNGKNLDKTINCQLLDNPDNDSTTTNLSPNGQELLAEYERAKARQLAEQRQDTSASKSSDKWTSYLSRLRYAILNEAPIFVRTQFLINQIRDAVESDHLEEGTADNPGVIRLARELAREPLAVIRQEEGSYAKAIDFFLQQVIAGILSAIRTAEPPEIMNKIYFLDVVFTVIEYAETTVKDALDPKTLTDVARAMVQHIGNRTGVRGTKD